MHVGVHDLRRVGKSGPHRSVDATPYGGGAEWSCDPTCGAQPSMSARDPAGPPRRAAGVASRPDASGVTHPSERHATLVEDLAGADQIVVACGRYEVDASGSTTGRGVEVLEFSIGDYVNGEKPPRWCSPEAVARLLDGFMKPRLARRGESHSGRGCWSIRSTPSPLSFVSLPEVLLDGIRRDWALASRRAIEEDRRVRPISPSRCMRRTLTGRTVPHLPLAGIAYPRSEAPHGT